MNPTIREICEQVLPHFGLEHEGYAAMQGRDRHKTYAEARQVCMWLARTKTTLSFPEIAREFGRDHTTAMHAFRRIGGIVEQSPNSHLGTIARTVLENYRGRQLVVIAGAGGVRELEASFMPPVKIEIDEEPMAAGKDPTLPIGLRPHVLTPNKSEGEFPPQAAE